VAIAIAIPLPSSAGGARAALRAPLRDASSRVYSPFGQRRLARPMAVPLAEAERGDGGPPGRLRIPLVRIRRS
jgi:hypothetical protein